MSYDPDLVSAMLNVEKTVKDYQKSMTMLLYDISLGFQNRLTKEIDRLIASLAWRQYGCSDGIPQGEESLHRSSDRTLDKGRHSTPRPAA